MDIKEYEPIIFHTQTPKFKVDFIKTTSISDGGDELPNYRYCLQPRLYSTFATKISYNFHLLYV